MCPLGGQFGTLLQHNSTTFSERDSGCDFRADGYFRGVTVAARRWPGSGKGSLQNPTLEGYGDDLIRTATMQAWRGGSSCLRPPRHRALPGHPLDPFSVPLGFPWTPFGYPWTLFGSPVASLGFLLGPPGPLLASLGHLLGAPWTPLDSRTKKGPKKSICWPPVCPRTPLFTTYYWGPKIKQAARVIPLQVP